MLQCKHRSNAHQETVPIKGYRLVPKMLQGITFVDGELPDEEERVA
ncbi:MAG TPA: hypothetical protein VKF36_24055 [Syntrophorhabdales bacterium]|nr:hypothetical protein [Syntrophorhabdales bacterium]